MQKFLHGEGRDCPGEGKCETRGGFRARQKCLSSSAGASLGVAASAGVSPIPAPGSGARGRGSFTTAHSPPPTPRMNGLFGSRDQWGGGGVPSQGVPAQGWLESTVVRCGQHGLSSQKWMQRRNRTAGTGVLPGETLLCTPVCEEAQNSLQHCLETCLQPALHSPGWAEGCYA